MRTMYDAVTADNILAANPRPQMVAGYVDKIKLEPWSGGDWALFPDAVKVQIVKKATTNAGHVLDVEPGDATPSEAPGWVKMRRAAGADPTVYCNASTWPTVRAAFQAAGVAEPHWWIAHYDGDPTIPAGAVAKQYRGDVAPGYDVSSVVDYWPGVDPAPGAPGGSAAQTTQGVELMERITVTPKDKGSHAVRLYLPGGPNCRVVVRPRLAQKDAKSPVWIGHIFAWGDDGAGVGHDPATVPGYDDRLDNHRTYLLPGALWCDLNYSSADPFEIDILG